MGEGCGEWRCLEGRDSGRTHRQRGNEDWPPMGWMPVRVCSPEPEMHLRAWELPSLLQRKPPDSNCSINSKQANTTLLCTRMEQRCWPRSSPKA